jgi:hypothetical protein
MSNHPSTTCNGPWRLLILDRDPADPKWIVATVASPGDVRPADPGEATVDEVAAAWAAGRGGIARAALTPLPGASCWRVDEAGNPG